MIKKFSLIILFFTAVLLFSNTYMPQKYLPAYTPFENNKIDYYKNYHKHLSLFGDCFCMLNKLNARTVVTPDYETGYIKVEYKIKNRTIGNPIYITLDEYTDMISKSNFEKNLKEKVKSILNDKNRQVRGGLIKDFVIKLPPQYVMSKGMKKFLGGDEAAHLNLSGHQTITLTGGSTKKKNMGDSGTPLNLKMKQDLSLHLNGTIGKKIIVKVDHETPDGESFGTKPDKVDISYKGLDDEIVKTIKGGDNDISLSGLGSAFSTSGLFGVKAEMQIGDLQLTSVIGKDQAQNNEQDTSGKATTQKIVKSSKDFANNYFYIAPPDSLYKLVDSNPAYPSWIGNAFELNDKGQWIVKSPELLPATGTGIKVFIDNDNANDDNTGTIAIPGHNWDNPADTTTYHFNRLIDNQDYYYDSSGLGLIILNQNIPKQYTIGIIYTKRDSSHVGLDSDDPDNPDASTIWVKIIKAKNQDKYSSTWGYQCRNIYDLGVQDINNDGFELSVFDQNTDGTENTINPIDNQNYTDYLRLNTNGTDNGVSIINGDDTTIDLHRGLIIMPFINPFYALGDSIIYEESNLSGEQTKMYIKVKGKINNNEINLGLNVLRNSVSVILNGNKLKEGSDYIVDYDFGTVTLLNREAINSSDKLKIKWQNIPLFSLASKTLIATDAKYNYGDKLSFEGFIGYQSEKVRDERPKIGGENRNIILTALKGSFEQPLPFLTKAIDWLPLLNTDTESKMVLDANIGMSVPHIYGSSKQPDKSEAYVEDMEATLEATNLGVTRKMWVPSSKPLQLDFSKTDINWFNNSSWRAGDVYDNLSDKEKKERISVMTVKATPDSTSNDVSWAGLMRYLGNEVDISKKEYIELMIQTKENDSNQDINVHIDLGKMSEDFYTKNGGENILNTEDGKGEGSLNGTLDVTEDIGLDMLPNKDEVGYNDNNTDPNNDNFSDEKVHNEYPYINRTEGNGDLDTEDLNNNNHLDKQNSYFEYSFLLSEISQWYVSSTHSEFKFYRIPLKEFTDILTDDNASLPSLKRIDYARIWFDFAGKIKLNIASFDLIGNKWQKMAIRNERNDDIIMQYPAKDGEELRIGVADNQRNPHYVQPKQTYIKSVDHSLEQSVFVDYTSLQENSLGLIYEPLKSLNASGSNSTIGKGLDLRGYKKIRFLTYAEDKDGSVHFENKYLRLHYMLCSDSLNYYEIIYDSLLVQPYDIAMEDGLPKMKASKWNQVEVDFSELTSLKAMDSSQLASDSTYFNGKYRLRIVHEKNKLPTLTNIKMIMMGVSPVEGSFDGRVYFDDIRVVDARQDIGYKFTSSFTLNLADLSDVAVSYNYSTPNFLNSAERNVIASLKKSYSLNLSNTWHLNKFFPAEWGLKLPLRLTENRNYSLPLYRNTTDDVLRKDLTDEEKKAQVSKSNNFNANISYSMNKTPRSKILEYTLKKTTFDFDYKKGSTNTATSIDSSETYTSHAGYNLDFSQDAIDIKLWKNYKFYFFPNSFKNSITYTEDRKSKWRYAVRNDTLLWYKENNVASPRTVATVNEIGYKMFSDLSFSYKLNTTRDLRIINYFKKIPIGIEKKHEQKISSSYSPTYLDKICSISLTPQVTYADEHKKTGMADTLYYSGGVVRSIPITLGLKNSDLLKSFVEWLDAKSTAKQKQKVDDKKDADNKKLDKDKKSATQEEDKKKDDLDDKSDIQNDRNNIETTKFPSTEEEGNVNKNKEDRNSNIKGDDKDDRKDKNIHKNRRSSGNEIDVKSNNIFIKSLAYLTRISNINFSYSNSYSTKYNERLYRPEFLYQLGMQGVLEDEQLTRQEFGNNISLSTNFAIINNLTTSWGYSKDFKETWEQTKNYTDKTTFPDIGIRLSNFGSIIHMDHILESSELSSGFVHDFTVTGKIGEDKANRTTENFRFTPLISWTGNWVYDITSRLSANYSQTIEVINNGASDVVRLHPVAGLTAHVDWSFSAPSGLNLPLLKRIHFKNKLTPKMDITFSQDKQYNKGEKNPEKYSREFKISPGASYEFNENISGTLSSDYSIIQDLKKNSSIRTFNLNVIINITF